MTHVVVATSDEGQQDMFKGESKSLLNLSHAREDCLLYRSGITFLTHVNVCFMLC